MADLIITVLSLVIIAAVMWAIGLKGLIGFILYPWDSASWGNPGLRRRVLHDIEAALEECMEESE